MLKDWNFSDTAANSTIPQINRQKSARNLEVIAIDPRNQVATFLDQKKKQKNTASLSQCDCHDFGFAGTNPRKSFKPCMHIYRLAIELGLLEAKYEDSDARRAAVVEEKRFETDRLQDLDADRTQWGGWNSAIHESGIQKNRQYRAYMMLDEEEDSVRRLRESSTIHDYAVTLSACECGDYRDRRLPCKHIYAAALANGIGLPVSRSEYVSARSQGRENVFRFEDA